MRLAALLYVALEAIGVALAVVVPVAVHRHGSESVALWTATASPGPLSAAHDFLGAQCETCHVPVRGVEAASCLTCHATAAPDLLTKSLTAFHESISQCASCYVEHQGRGRRPINMDHAVLIAMGWTRAAEVASGDVRAVRWKFRHGLTRLQALVGRSIMDLRSSALAPQSLPGDASGRLDCASCHANREPHRTLFGRDWQGCHGTVTWAVSGFRHPSPRSRDCVQCHQAPPSHYMMHFGMMDQAIAGQGNARVEQCFLCHQTDAWNNIRGVGWYKHR